MQKVLSDIKVLNGLSLELVLSKLPLYYFDDTVIDYLDHLSKELFKNKNIKSYPDLLTLAFYCRKSNLINLKNSYSNENDIKIGKGIAFHVTPSNVPLNFVYSFITGLVCGNVNIVRVPTKYFHQVELFFLSLNKLNENIKFREISSRSIFIKYDKTSNATEYFSSICDVRIIWGGDQTINSIRKNVIPSRSNDVTFADRFSFSVINAKPYLNYIEKQKLALGFFNDTYLFDQNACTSPHIVFWLGDVKDIACAKELFWSNLNNLVLDNYQISAITGVDKLTAYYSFKTNEIGSKLIYTNNYLWRIELDNLPLDIDKFKGNSGYFFEFNIDSLDALKPIISSKYQSFAYFGFSKNELKEFILSNNLKGIDRVVPIGKTAEFSLTWDGYNLIEHLTRTITIL